MHDIRRHNVNVNVSNVIPPDLEKPIKSFGKRIANAFKGFKEKI